MKRFAGTLATLAVLAALAGYYFFVDLPREQKEREEKDRSQRVLLFKFEDVTRFAYEHGDLRVRAEKENNAWRLTEPLPVPADARDLSMFLNQIEEARISRVVDEAPKDLALYGLAEPRFRLQVHTPKLGEKTVLIGDIAPSGHSLYVKRADEKRVLLVPGTPESWKKSVYDFRDKTILDYQTPEVTAVTLVQPKHTLELKKQDGVWRLVAPVKARGDASTIEDLLNAVRYARIVAFDEEQPKDLARYGLDAPRFKLIVTTPRGTHELWAGADAQAGTHYARRASASNMFQVPQSVIDRMQSSYLELIDKQVLPVKADEVVQLQIQEPQRTLRLVRGTGENPEWKLESPLKAQADAAAVNSLLFDLNDARAKKFVTFGTPEAFGLDHPQKTLTVTRKDGGVDTLTLGNPNLKGDEFFAARSLDQAVFVLDKETVGKLFRSLDDLRDRRLMIFAGEKAQTIRLTFPEQTFELKRNGEQWDLLQPERIEHLKPFIGNDVLWTLNNLRFEKELPPEEAARADFKNPRLVVAVSDAQDKTLARVVVGPTVAGHKQNLARVDGRPGVVAIADRLLSEIPHTLEKFRQARAG